MKIDLTGIIVALMGLLGTILTVKVIPLIQTKLSNEELSRLKSLVSIGVQAADQLVKNGTINKEERTEHVIDYLNKNGYTLNLEEVEDLIEAAVYELPSLIIKEEKIEEDTAEEDKE